MTQKFSVVVDGTEQVSGLTAAKAELSAEQWRKVSQDVKIVPHDPDDPTDGPAALKAMFQM